MPPEMIEWVRSLGPFGITILVSWWLIQRYDKAIERKEETVKDAIKEFKSVITEITTRHEDAFKKMAESQEKRDAAYESLADKKIIAILELGAKVESLQTAFRDFKAEQANKNAK